LGDLLCVTHLEPLPEGRARYSATFLPILKESQGGTEWAAISTRKLEAGLVQSHGSGDFRSGQEEASILRGESGMKGLGDHQA